LREFSFTEDDEERLCIDCFGKWQMSQIKHELLEKWQNATPPDDLDDEVQEPGPS
jgi:hypothetical protein